MAHFRPLCVKTPQSIVFVAPSFKSMHWSRIATLMATDGLSKPSIHRAELTHLELLKRNTMRSDFAQKTAHYMEHQGTER